MFSRDEDAQLTLVGLLISSVNVNDILTENVHCVNCWNMCQHSRPDRDRDRACSQGGELRNVWFSRQKKSWHSWQTVLCCITVLGNRDSGSFAREVRVLELYITAIYKDPVVRFLCSFRKEPRVHGPWNCGFATALLARRKGRGEGYFNWFVS